MKQFENILVTVSEECAEIQTAVSKALRFGLGNHHPDNADVTNADDILYEFIHLSALIENLQQHGMLPEWDEFTVKTMKNNKIRNVSEWQEVSFKCGTLDDNPQMTENARWLTTVPASDCNFKYRLKLATEEEIKEALSIMTGAGKKGNASRIAACNRELRRRAKAK